MDFITKKTAKPTLLLLFLFFITGGVLNAQSYCNYTAQVAYDFGLTSTSIDVPYGIIEQPDGKLLIYGTSYFNTLNSFKVSMMRLNADLTIDSTGFGQNGKVVKTWSQRNTCLTAELQSDGKILVAGTQAPGNGASTIRPFVGRFNSDASIDSTFGTYGSVLMNSYGKGNVIGMKELPNGKIRVILTRNSPRGIVMTQLNSNGTTDLTFATNGVAFHPVPLGFWDSETGDVMFTADTSAIVAWVTFSGGVWNPMVMKISSNGDVDSTFAVNGILDIYQSLNLSATGSGGLGTRGTLTQNEDIIIGATTGNLGTTNKMFLYKINGQTGIIDSTGFGTNGKVISSLAFPYNSVKNIRVNPTNGDIYALGTSSASGRKAATWKVSSSGVEMNQCGGNPIITFLMGYPYYSSFNAAVFTCNGAFRMVGSSGQADPTVAYNSQNRNFMIPHDTMPNPITFVSDTACDSYLSPSGNFVWDSTGTYMDTMTNVLGCDSLISVDLLILNSTTATINPVACDSYTSPSGVNSWTTTGMYVDTIPNAVGCDSVITVNLTVNYSTMATISATVCNSYSSPSGNYVWTNSGTYMDTIPNAMGCDSVITVNLNVSYSTSSTVNVTVCNSYVSPSGNYTWIISGTYMDTIPNAVGCDSVITVNLNVSYSTSSTINVAVCNSYTSPSGANTWTSSGSYMDTIPNLAGCDSVITVNLTINTPTAATFNITACDHYVSPTGNDIWLTSGTYTATIPNSAGCDSVITVNLTINNPDTTVAVSGFILTASAVSAQYQWLDCNKNMEAINGATNQTFVPTANGNYAVEVTQNGCTDTSACFAVVGVGIDEQSIFSELNFYPNPNNGTLNFDFGDLKQVAITIHDLNGKMVYQELGITNQNHQLTFQAAPGIYVLEVQSEGISKTYKLIVQ